MGLYDHYVLPRILNFAMRQQQLAPYRQRALGAARGRVLEIGMGSGLNFPYYPALTTLVVGLEPHAELRRLAARNASGILAPIAVAILAGSAEAIPLAQASVDTVVSTWTMCSIPNISAALREMHRVLRPDGQLLFAEHGLAPDAHVRRWQRRLSPVWSRIAGGCHLERPMREIIEEAGFEISKLETGYMPGPKLMTFMYEGRARPI
ncbi:MAG: class I SAM-dependent methyltransferase [Acidobacteriota bacterium]